MLLKVDMVRVERPKSEGHQDPNSFDPSSYLSLKGLSSLPVAFDTLESPAIWLLGCQDVSTFRLCAPEAQGVYSPQSLAVVHLRPRCGYCPMGYRLSLCFNIQRPLLEGPRSPSLYIEALCEELSLLARLGCACLQYQHMEGPGRGGQRVEGHPQVASEFEAILGYRRLVSKFLF